MLKCLKIGALHVLVITVVRQFKGCIKVYVKRKQASRYSLSQKYINLFIETPHEVYVWVCFAINRGAGLHQEQGKSRLRKLTPPPLLVPSSSNHDEALRSFVLTVFVC